MNIRKFWRLSCLTVASLFWASCGSDSNPQFAVVQSTNPDSSADAFGDSSSSETALPEESSSSVTEENTSSSDVGVSSSSETAPPSSSADVPPASSSEAAAISSAEVASSASAASYVLAKDPSVTCKDSTYKRSNCPEDTRALTCDDYKIWLGAEKSLSQKILTEWENKLQSCGAIREPEPVYGIVTPVCYPSAFYDAPMIKCSNGSLFKSYKIDGNLVYGSEDEYNEAHGVFPEDLVKNCPQSEFALFTDVLADVQTTLYEKLSKQLEEDSTLTEKGKEYLESLLDNEKKTLKGPFSPYLPVDYTSDDWLLKEKSSYWFSGYIAKFKTCEDSPSKTENYLKIRGMILAEALDLISKNVKAAN